jgi:hypothetical protein
VVNRAEAAARQPSVQQNVHGIHGGLDFARAARIPDATTASGTADVVDVFLGDGAAGFTFHSTLTYINVRALWAADIYGDGRSDLVVWNLRPDNGFGSPVLEGLVEAWMLGDVFNRPTIGEERHGDPAADRVLRPGGTTATDLRARRRIADHNRYRYDRADADVTSWPRACWRARPRGAGHSLGTSQAIASRVMAAPPSHRRRVPSRPERSCGWSRPGC